MTDHPTLKADPEVSVIMPAYRTPDYIGESIASVLGQTFEDFELIIIDDHSRDSTVQKAREAAGGDERVKIIELADNRGAGPARNAGIEQARGRFIAFLDSDDLWYPDKLERQVAFMKEYAAPLSFGRYDYIDEQSRKVATMPAPATMTYNELLRCCPIGCLTAMYDREQVGIIKMSSLRKRQDWATWLKVLKGGGVGRGMEQALGAYRRRDGSLSRSKVRLIGPNWTLYRTEVGLGRLQSAYYLGIYIVNYVLRQRVPGFAERFGFI